MDLLRAERRIIAVSALLVLTTGILVSAAISLPLHRSAHIQTEEVNAAHAQTLQTNIEHQLDAYRTLAVQFTSRTEIRKALEAWHAGQSSLEEVRQFSRPRLQEPARHLDNLAAMFRVSQGDIIAAIGPLAGQLPASEITPVPFSFILLPDAEQPLPLIRASAPIRTPSGVTIGHDILFFYTDKLIHHLENFAGYGEQAQVFFHHEPSQMTLGLMEHQDGRRISERSSELRPHMAGINSRNAGVYRSASQPDIVLINRPFRQCHASLVIKLPDKVFYAQANHNLFWANVTILVLLVCAVLLTRQVIRPLLRTLTRQTKQLKESHAEMQLAVSVFDNTHEAIFITDVQLGIVRANAAAQSLTGRSEQQLAGTPLHQCLHMGRSERQQGDILLQLHEQGFWQGEVSHRDEHGQQHISLLNTSTVWDTKGQPLYYIHVLSNITARKAAEQRIRHLAAHDPLTGLLNRHSMQHCLRTAIAGETRFALLFVDLDKFKPVNDRYGHKAGDDVIRQVAQRLRQATRKDDVIARFGGDEFLIMLEIPGDSSFLTRVADQVIELMTRPFDTGTLRINIGASVGIARFPDDGNTAEAVIHAADQAMYKAKYRGGDQFAFASGPSSS